MTQKSICPSSFNTPVSSPTMSPTIFAACILSSIGMVTAANYWTGQSVLPTVLPLSRNEIFGIAIYVVAISLVSLVVQLLYTAAQPYLKFIWHCMFRPLSAVDQRTRLDEFYSGQAEIYDSTRGGLLKGRETMLNLSVAHLRSLREKSPNKRLVWVDIGGGTGHNIEMMDAYFPISSFDAVYLVDLCEPLLQVARKRFAAKGWKNVTVLCQDATEFFVPEWSDGKSAKDSVGFVTLSYSLSMIPSFYPLLDRVEYVLDPDDGIIGVADFYTAKKQSSLHERAIGGANKNCGWLSRWFWQIWFDFDHVSLSPQRRDYLEYRFGTVKSFNGRNNFIIPLIVRIPYYVWIGRSRRCDVSKFCHAFEVEGGNMIGNCSPGAFPPATEKDINSIPLLEIGEPAMDLAPSEKLESAASIEITSPLSSFHYQVRQTWRLPFYEQPVHKEFRTYIYAFTWEDPFVDMKHLQLGKEDSMFVITSAGDNALHYAIAAQPQRIHCVDMNPCQGHLLELKLAAIQTLPYEDFFALFGKGCHPDFRTLLDSKIAPLISSAAYQFWRIHADSFSSAFYLQGYSGWALRLGQIVFRIAGVTKDVLAMCDADTLEEQWRIWSTKLRPALLNKVVVALLKSPVFCWNALGVPLNQRKMILDEGSFYDFIADTFDPVVKTHLLKTGSYFYLLALLGHYTPSSCPEYLTRAGFDALKANNAQAMDAFRLHTDSIINVLSGLPTWSLTRALIMDHLDWYAPGSPEVDAEVREFNRVVAKGGFVFWRSAAKKPRYNEVFENAGFAVTPLGVRNGAVALDQVNMYASFWRGVKN